MIKLKNIINSNHNSKTTEYEIDDFDNPKGWNWKEAEHLIDMGFEMSGTTRFKLDDKKNIDDVVNVEIYKSKPDGDYVMILNGRKHVFRSFLKMLEKIQQFGSEY